MAKPKRGVENSTGAATATKKRLRKRALAWIGAKDARVFEAFAGSGAMWRAVWRDAAECIGSDVRPVYDPARALYVENCQRVMRAIDMSRFNIVDLDAFGSPWPAAFVLSARRTLAPGERFVLITTDGGRINAKLASRIEGVMAHLADIDPKAAGASMSFPAITKGAADGVAQRMGGKVAWSEVDMSGFAKQITYSVFGIVGLEPGEGEGRAEASAA